MCVSGPVKVQGKKVLLWLSQRGIGGFSEFGTNLHPKGNKGDMLRFISSEIHDGTWELFCKNYIALGKNYIALALFKLKEKKYFGCNMIDRIFPVHYFYFMIDTIFNTLFNMSTIPDKRTGKVFTSESEFCTAKSKLVDYEIRKQFSVVQPDMSISGWQYFSWTVEGPYTWYKTIMRENSNKGLQIHQNLNYKVVTSYGPSVRIPCKDRSSCISLCPQTDRNKRYNLW